MSLTFHAQCHCGNLELTFETSLKAEQLPVRECACSFCRRHGARNTSDPKGTVKITVHDSNLLIRYQFGLKTADFLICKQKPTIVSYDRETEAERRARRGKN